MADNTPEPGERRVSRRDMLRASALTLSTIVITACGSAPEQAAESTAASSAASSAAQEGQPDAAAAPPAADAVEIVATSQMEVPTWDVALAQAKEQFPNVNLKVSQTVIQGGWSAYADTIVTQIAGGEQLDVIMIAIEGLGLLSSKNVLQPLDEFIKADTEATDMINNDVHKTLREMMQYQGKQMEFPFSWNNMVMYYNTKILEDQGVAAPGPDWTWDDFLATAQQVANVTGGAEDRYGYSFWGAGMFGMSPWYFNNGTSALTPDWKDSNMLDPKVAETLQFMADLILKHKVSPNPTGWDEWPQFHAGNLVMRTCGRWCIGGSMEENFTTYDLQYMPHKSGELKTVVGTDGWGIATTSKQPNEAWQMVKVLSGKDSSRAMVKLGGNIPALRSVADEPAFAEHGPANTKIFYESLDYAATVPSPNNFNIIEPILDRHYATIWNGEQSVDNAVQAAHAELQAEMDKLK